MTWWTCVGITGATLLLLALALGVRWHGWRRGSFLVLDGVMRAILTLAPIALAGACLGTVAGWCTVPLAIATSWVGRSPLGMLNFLLLQWFGVRLCASYDEQLIAVDVIRPGRWWSRCAPPRDVPVSWSLLRWVWPLTGWWSEYRWIARRS